MRWAGVKRLWPAIAWAVLLFVLSSIPGHELPELQGPFGLDKLIHALVFAVLGVLAYRGWPAKQTVPWIVFVFCVGYGVTDELHQVFVPGRTPDIWDLVADTVGAAAGIWGYRLWRRKHQAETGRDPGDKDA